jgi:hypothetical protein
MKSHNIINLNQLRSAVRRHWTGTEQTTMLYNQTEKFSMVGQYNLTSPGNTHFLKGVNPEGKALAPSADRHGLTAW